MRLVTAVMGISVATGRQGAQARADQTQALLNWGFRQYETLALKELGQAVAEPRIWKGGEKYLPLGVAEPFYVTVPRGSRDDLRLEISLSDSIEAPVSAGQEFGTLAAFVGDEKIATQPFVAQKSAPRGGFFRVIIDHLVRFISSFFK